MTYCIMTVIYGIPLLEEASKKIDEWERGMDGDEPLPDGDERWSEDTQGNICGFTTLYSGSAPWKPGYCGVRLCQFDECTDAVDVKTLRLTPTGHEVDDVKRMIDALHPELRALCGRVGVYFIPSTS